MDSDLLFMVHSWGWCRILYSLQLMYFRDTASDPPLQVNTLQLGTPPAAVASKSPNFR